MNNERETKDFDKRWGGRTQHGPWKSKCNPPKKKPPQKSKFNLSILGLLSAVLLKQQQQNFVIRGKSWFLNGSCWPKFQKKTETTGQKQKEQKIEGGKKLTISLDYWKIGSKIRNLSKSKSSCIISQQKSKNQSDKKPKKNKKKRKSLRSVKKNY